MELRLADWEVAVESWDFDEAVQRTIPKVSRWVDASIDLYRELYLAREALSRKGGDRMREGQYQRTWSDYCNAIGYTRQTVNAKLKNFVPAELSETGKDCFKIEAALSKEDRETISAGKVSQFRLTGQRPDNWTDEDEAYLRRLSAEESAASTARELVVNILKYKKQHKPSRDYFTEMLSRDHVKELSRFKIEDRKLRTAQQNAADSLAGFLYSIDDLNERAKAAANLVIRLKDIINDSIEEAVMQQAEDYDDDIEDADFEVQE